MREDTCAIMMMGRTAAGKTTTARFLSDLLGIEHILFSKFKRQVVNDQYSARDSLREDLRDVGYALGIEYATKALQRGESVILDASFHKLERRRWAYSALSGVCPVLIRVYCLTTNLDETRNRIARRRGLEHFAQHHASDFSIFQFIDKTFDEPTVEEKELFSGCLVPIEIDTFSGTLVCASSGEVMRAESVTAHIRMSLAVYLRTQRS